MTPFTLTGVLFVEGSAPTVVRHSGSVRFSSHPEPGVRLPVRFPPGAPTSFTIDWARVPRNDALVLARADAAAWAALPGIPATHAHLRAHLVLDEDEPTSSPAEGRATRVVARVTDLPRNDHGECARTLAADLEAIGWTVVADGDDAEIVAERSCAQEDLRGTRAMLELVPSPFYHTTLRAGGEVLLVHQLRSGPLRCDPPARLDLDPREDCRTRWHRFRTFSFAREAAISARVMAHIGGRPRGPVPPSAEP